MKRAVIVGRVFLTRRDAESFARKVPVDFKPNITETPSGHYMIVVNDYGDIDRTSRLCNDLGIRAFVWRMPKGVQG